MKKLLLFAALVMAALTMRAQSPAVDELPADSVSVMFRQFNETNAQVSGLQKALVAHATMVSVGAAMEIGGTLLLSLSDYTTPRRRTFGTLLMAGGLAVTVASFVPLVTHKVKVEGNAVVVPLHK